MRFKVITTLLLLVLVSSVRGEDRNFHADQPCGATYGTTGSALPTLIQEAVKVFSNDRYPVKADQIVYLNDLHGFLDCMGIVDLKTRNLLFKQELIVFSNRFPIYFNGNDLKNDTAVRIFQGDRKHGDYLKYVFAAFLGNGWVHASGEKKDYPAYSLELSLLEGYRQHLPATKLTEKHLNEVRTLMEEAKSARN